MAKQKKEKVSNLSITPLESQQQFLPLAPTDVSPQQFHNLLPEYGALEAAGAAMELAAKDTAISSISRIMDMNKKKYDGSPLATPEELNNKFQGMDEPFRESMTIAAANEIYDRQMERRRLEHIIAQGPSGFFQGSALQFAAAIVPHIFDPVELGADFLTGGALNFVGKALVNGKRFSSVGRVLTTQTFARTALSGAIGNLATEPLNIAAHQQEMSDYTVYDAFVGSVGGAIGFSALTYGASAAMKFLRNAGSKHADIAVKSAIGQVQAGKRLDVDPILADMKADINDNTKFAYEFKKIEPQTIHDDNTKFAYEFKKIEPQTIHGKTQYVVPDRTFYMAEQMPGERYTIGEGLGATVHLTDNPNIAHGHASSRAQGFKGSVSDVKISEPLNLIDLDRPIETADFNSMLHSFKQAGFKQEELDRALKGKKVKSFNDLLVRLNPDDEQMKALAISLEQTGYDGFIHNRVNPDLDVTKPVPKKESTKGQAIALFNENKIQVGKTVFAENNYRPSEETVRTLKEKQLSNKSNSSYDEAEDLEYKANKTKALPKAEDIRSEKQLFNEDLEQKMKLDDLDAEDKEILKTIKKEQAAAEIEEQATKAAIKCVDDNG